MKVDPGFYRGLAVGLAFGLLFVWHEVVMLFGSMHLVIHYEMTPLSWMTFGQLWLDVFETTSWSQPLRWHIVFGLLTVLLFTTHAVWRRQRDVVGSAVRVDVGLASAGFWALVVTGLLAGKVVYG